jgi:2,4-dienoyl-CoA reductase-like NADH-dependent reductase (Old Yellow Enzyme family)
MMTNPERYPHLLSPISLGPVTLRNRSMISAHGMGLADGANSVSERYHAYLAERARGGAALLGMESAPVAPGMDNRSLRIRLYEDEVIPGLERLARDVHDAGACLSITLWQGGHTESFTRGRYALSPSAIPNMAGEMPKVISKTEIKTLIGYYAAAAERCMRAGLDAVQVQTATNYLLGSFLNPALNHRNDEYGGSRDNRVRIVLEILDAIRERVGDRIAVGVRTSVAHGIGGAPEDYDEDESLAVMKILANSGLIDWVNIMKGSGWDSGQSIPPMDQPTMQLRHEGLTFRAALNVPLITSGNIRTPAEAESLLAEGAADVIAMARTWIAEPQWLNKVAAGDEASIRPCVSCNQGCVGMVWRGVPGTCSLNPRAGREIDLAPLSSGEGDTSVAVIGGGPAGMEVARLAALAGHQVTLYEATQELGGQLTLAAKGPTRQRWQEAIDWWQQALTDLNVSIRLGETVDPAAPPDADHVIWAIGAAPAQTAVLRLRPFLQAGLPGADGLVHGRSVMAGEHAVGGHVLVIDEEGGWPAVSLVEWLSEQPAVSAVSVITPERSLGEAGLAISFDLRALAARLTNSEIKVVSAARVARVRAHGVELEDGRQLGPFDQLLLSTGTAARTTPEDALQVGDCVAPRGLWSATNDAAWVVRSL